MPFETILSAPELNTHLHQPDWVVVDCRFDLADPEWGEEEYRALHIPGAIYAHTNRDLSSPVTPVTGRHPLPEPAAFVKTMSRFGIGPSTQVVAYDATSGSFAGRLWFLLRYYGHKNVAVLDGGLNTWLKAGFSTQSGWEENPAQHFSGKPNNNMIVTTREIESHFTQPDWRLIDSRAPERFSGQQETIDAKAGHIPGAVDRFYGLNSNPDGTFRDAESLRRGFEELTRGFATEKTVIYCGSGVTSTHNLLAMAIAGLPLPKLYPGSWSEWIRDPKHPIATGMDE